MKSYYEALLEQYSHLLLMLQADSRTVSEEMIQVIRDDIEDIQIRLGNASQIQPKLNDDVVGFEI